MAPMFCSLGDEKIVKCVTTLHRLVDDDGTGILIIKDPIRGQQRLDSVHCGHRATKTVFSCPRGESLMSLATSTLEA